MNRIVESSAKSSLNIRPSTFFSRMFRRNASTTHELDATKGDRERVVILGSGWSGFVLARQLDTKKFQPVVVSPRSYFAFTPLLASTAVGTLEFRTTLESVRARRTGVEFYQGWADDVNFNEKRLIIEEAARRPTGPAGSNMIPAVEQGEKALATKKKKGQLFDLSYDKLVVAVGCYSQTFGTPGVRENAFFLKDVTDAIKIRRRILECFETAVLPTTSPELKAALLNFAIVGGGPTGIEFAAELFDLCKEDLVKVYPALIPHVKITIYDVAPKILPMFDSKLADYALKLFDRDGIKIKTEHHIQNLQPGLPGNPANSGGCYTLKTKEEGEFGVGMCVWSTGLMMNPFIQRALDDVHIYPTRSAKISASESTDPASTQWSLKRSPRNGGLMVDDKFRVKLVPRDSIASASTSKSKSPDTPTPEATMHDVFALGDVSVLETVQLPATAQVASQEAKWLGKALNRGLTDDTRGFKYSDMGVLTYVGGMKAIMQGKGGTEIKGRTAWLIWRGAYLTKTISWRNKLLIPIYWAINWCFGRDISRF
ncbi:FAD/NAD(P)-binding protein [Glarea lozoyensis ATCC 20868]|uniref:FAD/NAD(P)-binding protein n=1 Tax=Glarea lozoyensis (strain ATCC 20868 / MF5171) TaxID=1116229 RepID=S3CMB8_GLAL2|nr:FAD/NAD(P)-binding protein [Glarea lozoyensis ATCC 20868]EPE27662.1 FAD/NAD(P)-binding protein [Glarea lozoyensis ATCC 20868]